MSNEIRPPQALVMRRRWILWKEIKREGEKPTKMPIAPWKKDYSTPIDATDPENCVSYEIAKKYLDESAGRASGLGFALGEGIVGIDLDHCINEKEELNELADEIIKSTDTYAELSPSGKGLHVLGFGEIPHSLKREEIGLEIYSERRYFTFTGKALKGRHDLTQMQELLEEIFSRYDNEPVDVKALLKGVERGNRNDAGIRLATYYRRLGKTEDEIIESMRVWNEKNKPPLSPDELGAIIRSAYRREKPYSYKFYPAPEKEQMSKKGKGEKSETYSLDEILNMHRVEEEEEIKLYARNVREEDGTRKELFLCIQDVKGNSLHVEGKTIREEAIFFPQETQPGEHLLHLIKDKEKCNSLDIKELFGGLKRAHAKFVHFSEDIDYDIVVLAAISSYFRNAIDTYPLIYFTSPSINTGKTTALYCLIYSSWYGMISSNLSEAVIYRAVNDIHPTLGLDEIDKYLKRPDLYINIISLFNTSNKKGSYVYRIEKQGDREIVKGYEHWGLKAVSGLYPLPSDMDSRAITIRLKRYTGKDISKTVPVASNFADIRDKLYVYALKNQEIVRETYEELKVSCPLEGRKFEKWAGILTMAKLVGNYDEILKYAQGVQESYEDLSDRDQALLYTLFVNKLVGERSTKEITEAFTAELRTRGLLGKDDDGEEKKVSPKEVPTKLRNFGFQKISDKKTENKTWFSIKAEDLASLVGIYKVVEKDRFEKMLKEPPYLPTIPVQNTPSQPPINANFANFPNSDEGKTTKEQLAELGELGNVGGQGEKKEDEKQAGKEPEGTGPEQQPESETEDGLTMAIVLKDTPPFVDWAGNNWDHGVRKNDIIKIETRTAKRLAEEGFVRILGSELDNAEGQQPEWTEGLCEWCGKQAMVKLVKGSYTCRDCLPDVAKEDRNEQGL